jgi:hypothetical protein
MEKPMSEPLSDVSLLALLKALLFWVCGLKFWAWLGGVLVLLLAPVLGFVLGLQVMPLDPAEPHKDLVRRLLGCVVSSLLLGVPGLIWLHKNMVWVFESARGLVAMMGAPEVVGPFVVMWGVLLVAALPGWWLVGRLVKRVISQDWDKVLDNVKSEVHP